MNNLKRKIISELIPNYQEQNTSLIGRFIHVVSSEYSGVTKRGYEALGEIHEFIKADSVDMEKERFREIHERRITVDNKLSIPYDARFYTVKVIKGVLSSAGLSSNISTGWMDDQTSSFDTYYQYDESLKERVDKIYKLTIGSFCQIVMTAVLYILAMIPSFIFENTDPLSLLALIPFALGSITLWFSYSKISKIRALCSTPYSVSMSNGQLLSCFGYGHFQLNTGEMNVIKEYFDEVCNASYTIRKNRYFVDIPDQFEDYASFFSLMRNFITSDTPHALWEGMPEQFKYMIFGFNAEDGVYGIASVDAPIVGSDGKWTVSTDTEYMQINDERLFQYNVRKKAILLNKVYTSS